MKGFKFYGVHIEIPSLQAYFMCTEDATVSSMKSVQEQKILNESALPCPGDKNLSTTWHQWKCRATLQAMKKYFEHYSI
jgi:hypothetical protein